MVIPIHEPKSKGTINISITIMVLHSSVGRGLFFPHLLFMQIFSHLLKVAET